MPFEGLIYARSGVALAPIFSPVLRVRGIVVEDAEGLGQVTLEYCVNDGVIVTVTWAEAAGRLRVDIDRPLLLPKGVKEGDRFRFRLRATDVTCGGMIAPRPSPSWLK